MPKPTFFNLPEEKRRAITEIAIDEFAECEYSEVSISRIVEKAGIAKGSFYQYFTDKQDLFFYLVDLSGQQKLEMLQQSQPPDPKMGLFAYLKYLIRAGLEYQFAQPKLNQVAYKAIYGTLPFRHESLQRMKDAAADYYRQLVEMGIAHGEIKPDINRETAAFVMGAVFNDFGNYYIRKIGGDPYQIVEQKFSEAEIQVLEETLDEVIQILKQGLGKTQ